MQHNKLSSFKEEPLLKKEIIVYLFDHISRKTYGQWYKYKGEFKYEGQEYNLECECKMDNEIFTYKNLFIEHKQVVIDIDDMVARGLIQ